MNIAKMLKEAQRMQERMAEAQTQLSARSVEASSGGGKVVVKATGSGEITSIVKETKNVKDVYYQLFLSLTDIQTGIEEWSETKDIRKTTER
jgi:DNA-binding protein YbaB